MILSEEDREFLVDKVNEEVENRIKLCKKEGYTEFQQSLLELPLERFSKFANAFFKSYSEKKDEKHSFNRIAKYGKKDILKIVINFKSEKQLEKKLNEIILDIQCGVFFEIIDLINKSLNKDI